MGQHLFKVKKTLNRPFLKTKIKASSFRMYKEYMYLSWISSLILYANVDKRVSDHDITFNFGATYFEQYKTTNLLSQEVFFYK